MSDYQHWRTELDSDNILWVIFDRADKNVNALNDEVLAELDELIDRIPQFCAKGVIFVSGKDNGFIAGADIERFPELANINQAISFLRQGQKVFSKLEAIEVPTVAMINGFCMGGGCELVLACDYRIALDEDKTKIGLPEVKLGIYPSWGGSVRLTRLIGAPKAMSIILAGSAVRASVAKRMGFVDDAVPMRHLKTAARSMILNKEKKHRPSFAERLSNWAPIRPLLAKAFYKQLDKKINKKHYPAPFAVVRNWVKEGAPWARAAAEEAYITEANGAGELAVNDTTRNLVRVFFLQNRMKALAKGTELNIRHVHVIGSGIMGGDIAAWCAYQGYTVTLQDREPKFIMPAIDRAYKFYKKKLKQPRAIQEVMDRLIPDARGHGIANADLIIEAIFEDLTVKQNLFKDLELKAKPTAILATNTSSIPLDDIGSVLTRPERLIGIHFFNPVAMMPLVEVVVAEKTEQNIVNQSLAFVTKLAKFPVAVKSHPGFLVNRCLVPYMMEAMAIMEEGVSISAIDKAAKDFGMPMGPIELADTVGLDVCLHVGKNLSEAFGGDVPQKLVDMVEKKQLGKKTNKGLYEYKNGKPIKTVAASVDKDVTDRMIFRMLNETVACLREGVIDDADLLDGGMIFGTGFAPFRGGPIQFARDYGFQSIITRFNELAEKYGDRFKPDAHWNKLI